MSGTVLHSVKGNPPLPDSNSLSRKGEHFLISTSAVWNNDLMNPINRNIIEAVLSKEKGAKVILRSFGALSESANKVLKKGVNGAKLQMCMCETVNR